MSRRESGFTLIEIMVALAVFGLAALALLRLQGVRREALPMSSGARSGRLSPITSPSRR